MKKGLIAGNAIIPADNESSVIADPCKSALDHPSFAVTPQFATILGRLLFPIRPMGSDHSNAFSQEPLVERITVIGFVANDPANLFSSRFGASLQGGFSKGYFGGRCAGKLASHRNTFAVDHHHPLRSFAFLGFPNAEPPFLAGAKLPSMKVSDHSRVPLSSSSLRKALQILSQTPSFSHRWSLLQQVAGLGYCGGRSFQRAPVRSTHSIPSRVERSSCQGRPRLGFRFGRWGEIFSHISSVKNWSRMTSISLSP